MVRTADAGRLDLNVAAVRDALGQVQGRIEGHEAALVDDHHPRRAVTVTIGECATPKNGNLERAEIRR